MYTAVSPVAGVANYTGQAQFYAINTAYRINKRLSLALGWQHVRSYAEFDPGTLVSGSSGDSSGIKEISRTKTTENTFTSKADIRLSEKISCILDYTFSDYDEKYSSSYDGSVHSVTATIAARW
jgi:hypothetical protein